jgi:hypothetical protein
MSRNLSLDEVKRMLAVAEKDSLRDALVFKLMAGYGLSVGEIVGTPKRRWDEQGKKWLPKEPVVKGLLIQDLSTSGILVRRKMGRPTETIALKPEFLQELNAFVGKRTKGRIFELSESRVLQLARRYAKAADILDEKLSPQTFIRFYERHVGILPSALSEVSEAKIGERKSAPVTISAHEMAQAAILELGNILGYETYTSDPSKDPGEQFYEVVELEGYRTVIPRTLGQIATLEEVPDFAPKRVLESAKDIDVIWFKDELPVVCFEVEHTTNVKQGLLRQFQISKHVPNARFFVIAPEDQRAKFEKEVATYPFKQIRNRYSFKSYDEFVEFYDGAWKFHDLRSKFELRE